jgi:hypothetical protein
VRSRASVPLALCVWALGLGFGCGVDQLVGLETANVDGGSRDGGRRDGGGDDGDGGEDDGDGGDRALACLAGVDAGLTACRGLSGRSLQPR